MPVNLDVLYAAIGADVADPNLRDPFLVGSRNLSTGHFSTVPLRVLERKRLLDLLYGKGRLLRPPVGVTYAERQDQG